MGYTSIPWVNTEEPKVIKVKREDKKVSLVNNKPTDLSISTAKVQKLFAENKNKTFSNSEISSKLNISEGTVSEITNRLEAIADIKIVKVRQNKSALSQVFQHIEGPLNAVEKERSKNDSIVNVLRIFKGSPDKVYSKQDILNILKEESESKVRRSLQILLLDDTIKLVDYSEHALYQYKTGDKKGYTIYKEENPNYMTINKFVKLNKVKDYSNFKKLVNADKARLFYSSKGLLIEFPKSELYKTLESFSNKEIEDKKSFLEKIFKK